MSNPEFLAGQREVLLQELSNTVWVKSEFWDASRSFDYNQCKAQVLIHALAGIRESQRLSLACLGGLSSAW